MKKFISTALILLIALGTLSGCFESANDSPNISEKEKTPPGEETPALPDNELLIYTGDQLFNKRYVDEDNFEQLIGQFVRKKFPDIKIRHVQWDDGTRYEDMIAKGDFPDIVLEDVRRNSYRYVRRFNLEYDMSDLIKKYNFDTSRLSPAYMQESINASDGKLFSLPFESSDYVLYYNKDLFDKFGVDYPQPGMTYDQIYELAKKLTRQEDDLTYKGYQQHPEYYMMLNQLGEPALSPTEDKASMLSQNWLKIVNNLRRFYEIPGNQFTTVKDFPKGQIAMAVDVDEMIVDYGINYKDLNFDVSSVPVFEGTETEYQPYSFGAFITNQSNNKNLAFQVLAYLLSDEVQIERAKLGVRSPVISDAVQQAFGQGVAELRGKNLQSVYALKSAIPAARKPGLTFIDPKVRYVFQPNIFEESKDSQTALRLVNEDMDKAIEETIAIEQSGDVSPHL